MSQSDENERIAKIEGKHELELKINGEGDGRKFLNFWDWAHGNDVCCQIKDEKLFLSKYDENGDDLPEKEITFAQFLELVEQSIMKRRV